MAMLNCKHTYHNKWGILAFLLMLAISGCTSDDDFGNAQPQEEMDITLNITFLLHGDVTKTNPRSPATRNGETTTPGTPVPESQLKSLSIFIVSAGEEGNILLPTIKAFRFTDNLPEYKPDGTGRTFYQANVTTSPGRKFIYVAANLSKTQESEFVTRYKDAGEKAVLSGSGTGDFISDNDGFAMFCTNKLEVIITEEQFQYPDGSDAFSFDLERLVAKILLTADTYESSNYIRIKDEAMGQNGWIELKHADYSLITTNTKVYPFPASENGTRVDPNYLIGLYEEDFVVGNTGAILAYNENKMPKANPPSGTDDVYTEGIYCLENIVHDAAGNTEEVRIKGTTHVRVSVRYIPSHLYVAEAGNLTRKSYSTQDQAWSAIGTQDIPGSHNIYILKTVPELYYTAEAKELAVNKGEAVAEDFTEYAGCRHSYTTYVDGLKNNVSGRLEFDDNSSVLRNHYYILRVTGFNIQNGPLLQVTSTVMPWTKEEEIIWHSEISASLKGKLDNYAADIYPGGIPVTFNMMNTTSAGTDLYNATFTLTLTGYPGSSWSASLSNPNDFGFYINSDNGLVANGTLPTKEEDDTVTEGPDGTITKEYYIAVYAKRVPEGITRNTYLAITVDGEKQLVNMSDKPMPGDKEQVRIVQLP